MIKKNNREQKIVSSLLKEMAKSVPPESFSIQQILAQLGTKGLYILTMVLTVPFLLPVSIPGTSIPFGVIIALIGLSIVLNKTPWLPRRLLNYRLKRSNLILIFERGSSLFQKIEKWTGPRLLFMTSGVFIRSFHGVFLVITAILLTLPLPLPFSNTLPAYGVLFLAIGSLEKDGVMIILGYVMIILTALYLTLVTIIGIKGIKALIYNLL